MAAIIGIVRATAGGSGWLWTVLGALDALVFVVALLIWLTSRRTAR